MNIGDHIIYKDNQLLVFNKPAGVPTQKDKTEDKSLLDLAEIYAKKKLWVTNRIDRPASGVTIFAKTPTAAAHINKIFADRKIEKKYLIAVPKGIKENSGLLSNNIKHQPISNKAKVTDKPIKGSKPAELEYKKLKELDNYDIIEVKSKSGRHHQIRAQFAHFGFPIKVDVKYGARRSNKDRSINLHCSEIEITHPVSGDKIHLECLPNQEDGIWAALAAFDSTTDAKHGTGQAPTAAPAIDSASVSRGEEE